jgi:Cdc6-like AAA superfamily ATPase
VTMAGNPFAGYGSIATGERLVGRRAELATLRDVVSEGIGSRAIIGEPKIGKSSVGYAVFEATQQLEDCDAHWIDLGSCGAESGIFDQLRLEFSVSAEGDGGELDSYQIVRSHLIQAKSRGRRHVVVLDEFDAISDTRDAVLSIRRLREIVSNTHRFGLSVLILSRRKLAVIETQIANLSTLDGVCPSIYLRPFHLDESFMP